MTSQDGSTSSPPPAYTERDPLLQDDISTRQNGTTTSGAIGSDTPVATERSTKGLILVLGSIWLGVFLAAIGTVHLRKC